MMAPITGVPTFGSAPINPNTATTASHASGTTPQTASSNPEPHGDNEATVTAAETATSTSTYPQAQPGAVPVTGPAPAPTGAVTASLYTPSPTTTSPPTTTTDQSTLSPPAPQPGSRPIPPPAASQSSGANNDLPPPPKVGEVPKPASYYTRATSPAATTGTGTGFGYTTQSTPAQGLNVPNSTSTPYNTVYQPPANNTQFPSYNYGAASRGPVGDVFQDEEEGVGQAMWKTAKSWVQTAGSKLAEVEAEVWKRVG